MELLGGQNRFPRSHLSEFFDVPAGCDRKYVTRTSVERQVFDKQQINFNSNSMLFRLINISMGFPVFHLSRNSFFLQHIKLENVILVISECNKITFEGCICHCSSSFLMAHLK